MMTQSTTSRPSLPSESHDPRRETTSFHERPTISQQTDDEFWVDIKEITREGARTALLTMLGEEVDVQRTLDGPSAPRQQQADDEFWVNVKEVTREGARTALLTMLGEEVDTQRTSHETSAPRQQRVYTEFWVHIRKATCEGARTALLTMLGEDVDMQRAQHGKPASPPVMQCASLPGMQCASLPVRQWVLAKEPAMVPLLADYH